MVCNWKTAPICMMLSIQQYNLCPPVRIQNRGKQRKLLKSWKIIKPLTFYAIPLHYCYAFTCLGVQMVYVCPLNIHRIREFIVSVSTVSENNSNTPPLRKRIRIYGLCTMIKCFRVFSYSCWLTSVCIWSCILVLKKFLFCVRVCSDQRSSASSFYSSSD